MFLLPGFTLSRLTYFICQYFAGWTTRAGCIVHCNKVTKPVTGRPKYLLLCTKSFMRLLLTSIYVNRAFKVLNHLIGEIRLNQWQISCRAVAEMANRLIIQYGWATVLCCIDCTYFALVDHAILAFYINFYSPMHWLVDAYNFTRKRVTAKSSECSAVGLRKSTDSKAL